MLRHFVRFLVRQKFHVYRRFPPHAKGRIAHNALTLNTRTVRRRMMPAQAAVDTSNGVLLDTSASRGAEDLVLDLGLMPHYGRPKNWDFLKAFTLITREVDEDDPVLDAGCGAFSVMLEWLEAAGYRDLHGCDYKVERTGRVGRIHYSNQDLTATTFPDASFAAITCLSVIEHNVDTAGFLREADRLLRPGGLLIISTDYWPEKIHTNGARPYGDELGETRVFDEAELRAFVAQAESAGFRPLTPMRYAAGERVVAWSLIPERYTFAFIAFRKGSASAAQAGASSGRPGRLGTGISISASDS